MAVNRSSVASSNANPYEESLAKDEPQADMFVIEDDDDKKGRDRRSMQIETSNTFKWWQSCQLRSSMIWFLIIL